MDIRLLDQPDCSTVASSEVINRGPRYTFSKAMITPAVAVVI